MKQYNCFENYLISTSRFRGLFGFIVPRYCNEVELYQYYY